jgi:hypothetical protein
MREPNPAAATCQATIAHAPWGAAGQVPAAIAVTRRRLWSSPISDKRTSKPGPEQPADESDPAPAGPLGRVPCPFELRVDLLAEPAY